MPPAVLKEGQTPALPMQALSRADLRPLIGVTRGSRVNFADGSSAIALEDLSSSSSRMIYCKAGEVRELEVRRVELFDLAISGIEKNAVDSRLRGAGGRILVEPRWRDLKSDDILEHSDGTKELILELSPSVNTTQFRVGSVLRERDGSLTYRRGVRSDLEMASTSPIRVIQSDTTSVNGTSTRAHRSDPRAVSRDPELIALDRALEALESKIAESAIRRFEKICSEDQMANRESYLELAIPLERIHVVCNMYRMIAVQLLNLTRAAPERIKTMLPDFDAISGSENSISDTLDSLGNFKLAGKPSENSVPWRARHVELCGLLRQQVKYIREILTAFDNFKVGDKEQRYFTRLETSDLAADLDLLRALSDVATISSDSSDLQKLSGGVVWSEYSPERFAEIALAGGRIITMRDRDGSSEGKIVGFMTYFPPSVLPENQRQRFNQHHRNFMPAAYIDMMCVAPAARSGRLASELLHKAHFLHLVREQANFSITEVHQNNLPAHGMAHRQGGLFDLGSRVQATDGKESVNWNPVILPVSSRAVRSTNELSSLSSFGQTALGGLMSRSVILSALPEVDRKALLSFYFHLRTAKSPLVVRLTGFSGNMPQQEDGWRAIFSEALRGASGAYMVGGTESLQTIDGEITPIARKDIVATPDLVRETAPEIKVGYIIVEPPGGLTLLNNPSIDAGRPVEVIDGLSKVPTASGHLATNPWVTIVNRKANEDNSFRTVGRSEKIWSEEATWGLTVADLVRADSNAFGDGVGAALVVYGGGQTSQNEIKMWAEKGYPVVLIRGSGGACDKTLADDEWMSRYGGTVTAVETAHELRNVLKNLGEMFVD